MTISLLVYPTILAIILNFFRVNYFLLCTIIFVIPAFVIFENFGIVLLAKIFMYIIWIFLGLARRRWYLSKGFLRSFLLFILLSVIFFLLGTIEGNKLENILIASLVILSPVLGYIFAYIFYYESRPYYHWALLPGIIIFIGLFLTFAFSNFEIGARLVFGSYAVGGYFGHTLLMYLPPMLRMATLFLLFLVVMDLIWGGSRRYYILPLVLLSHFMLKHKVISITTLVILTIIGMVYLLNFSYVAPLDEKATLNRGVGYRANEINIISDYILTSWKGLLFGGLPGFQFEQISHGTKGITDVGPRFHNFYYTIFGNLGLVGMVLFCVILFRNFRLTEILNYDVHSVLVVSWLIAMYFDQPPDGMWLLGYGIAVASMSKRQLALIKYR